MNYEFFTHRIGIIPEALIIEGLSLLEDVTYSSGSLSFAPRPGFKTVNNLTCTSELVVYVNALASLIEDIFPISALHSFDINVLGEHAKIKEHTDMFTNTNAGFACYLEHKVHFVLQAGGGWYSHRRDISIPSVLNRSITGDIIVFNNCVLHEVGNDASTPRIHLILIYRDRDWSIRQELYKSLGITHYYF